MVSVEKPGSPEEVLAHFGTKGMKWGVRKQQQIGDIATKGLGITTTGSRERSAAKARTKTSLTPAQRAHRKQVAKKVAIGVGVATIAVGVAATAYYLHKNGNLPLSSVGKSGGKVYKAIDDIPKPKVSAIVQAQRNTDRKHYIKLMMSSKKYAPTLSEATRIANETYGRL